jgi:hypothetical protein
MDATLRDLVRQRAGNRCEYCLIHQDDDPYFRFHIEHVLPFKHGGDDDRENLALSCRHCNLHKGPNIAGIDSDDGKLTPLFNPRRDVWSEHFAFHGAIIEVLRNIGRTTVHVHAMNDSDRVDLRIHAAS